MFVILNYLVEVRELAYLLYNIGLTVYSSRSTIVAGLRINAQGTVSLAETVGVL